MTTTPALNGQNGAQRVICMGTNVCGGTSGNALSKLRSGSGDSFVAGSDACGNWNAAANTTTSCIIIGSTAFQNSGAADARDRSILIGGGAARGDTSTQSGSGTIIMGVLAHQYYQPADGCVIIGDLSCNSKPASASDSLCVKIGRGIQRLATQSGGARQVLVGANIMESATCTFVENSTGIMMGYGICGTASGQLSVQNVFIGGNCLLTPVLGAANVRNNTIIGGGSLAGAGASLASQYATCLGGGMLVGAGAGPGTDDVVIGGRTFVANVAPLAANLVCLGAAQTGVPAANEVMIGYRCAASTVAGRLSFGNAMEAVAGAANAGAAALPATPQAFMPLNYNGVAYKIPLYLP